MSIPSHLIGTYFPTENSKADAKPLTISAGSQKGHVRVECASETFDGQHSAEVKVGSLSLGTYNLHCPPNSPLLMYDPSLDLIMGAEDCNWQSRGLEVSFEMKIVGDKLRCFYDSYPAKYTDGTSVPAYPEKPPHKYPINDKEYCQKGTAADDGGDCSIIMIKGYTLRLGFGMLDTTDFVFSTDPKHPWIVWSPQPKNFYTIADVKGASCVEKDVLDEGSESYSFTLWVQRKDGTFLKTDPTVINRADPGTLTSPNVNPK